MSSEYGTFSVGASCQAEVAQRVEAPGTQSYRDALIDAPVRFNQILQKTVSHLINTSTTANKTQPRDTKTIRAAKKQREF